jgi:predicted GNAT family acetyltransferase
MRVVAETGPDSFLEKVGAHLASSPVENNLLIGIASSVEPDSSPLLLRVESDTAIELVAVQTPPRPLVLGHGAEGAARRLAEHLASARVPLPGVLGPRETVEAFVRVWSELSRAFGKLERLQTLYELRELLPARAVAGGLREASLEDETTLATWSMAFQEEVGVYVGVGGDARPFVHSKMEAGQLFVWDDDGPVCMAGWAARTPNAVRVNYVYTPPAQRRKGYAGACVGALSRKLLDEGCEACILFADAANPTSNGVYRRLGYRPLSEFAHYELVSR